MGQLAKSKPHHQHQLRPCAVDTSKHHEHQLCRLAKSKPGGPHHQHQLRPCAVDTSKRDSIMSISCGSACKKQARWPTSSASAATLCRRYQQTGQHQEHQLRPCAVDTSKRDSIMSISCGRACNAQASGPNHQHQLRPGSLDTGKWARIMSISSGPACQKQARPTSSASAAGPFPKYQQT